MNEKKLVQNFRSYINVSPKNNGDKNGAVLEVKPKLLNGELVVGAAHSVVMLTPLSERDSGRYGSLFVTNYRLSFMPLEPTQSDEYSQSNYLLGSYDVPLTAVGAIWLTDGGPARRRRLLPQGDMPGKVKGLQIVCKNMKVLTFSFAHCGIGKGRTVALALLHHAYPKRHDLLFAFEYKEPYFPTLPADMNMFLRPGDWKRELERCECPHWRITCVNGTSDAFMLSAGETLVVPGSVLDYSLMETARHFRSGSVPIWVWGRPEGAALLRSGELLNTEHSATSESVYLEQVRRSHPKLTPPHVIYLCGNSFATDTKVNTNALPPLSALHSSYKRLVDLCTPTSLANFWLQDSQYYSLLDGSRWARHVGAALAAAAAAAALLDDNVTVLLQEGDGVDYAAAVSCLTQILVDPHCRTIAGLQSLIQKEWVALGHPFCDRLGLPRPGNLKDPKEPTTPQIAPVFLLFLDCVYQITRQQAPSLQWSEAYLVTLWDAAHNALFDTFLFNCPRDRELAVTKNFIPRPVWDWAEQFSEQDVALFYNPLYNPQPTQTQQPATTNFASQRLSVVLTSPQPPAIPRLPRLAVSSSVASVELWSTCYERWLPPLDAPGGGPVQFLVHNHATVREIRRLKDKLVSLSIMNNRLSNGDLEEPPSRPPMVSRFYPFSQNRTHNVVALDSMQVSLIDASQLLDSQSLLNAPD